MTHRQNCEIALTKPGQDWSVISNHIKAELSRRGSDHPDTHSWSVVSSLQRLSGDVTDMKLLTSLQMALVACSLVLAAQVSSR